MQTFMRMVRRVVHADRSLLLLGETGVGKERPARAIHEASPRGDGPFIPVNCSSERSRTRRGSRRRSSG
jgi:DNA-binding NtrC family response regulator